MWNGFLAVVKHEKIEPMKIGTAQTIQFKCKRNQRFYHKRSQTKSPFYGLIDAIHILSNRLLIASSKRVIYQFVTTIGMP